jgi:hypothetical protein
MSIICLEKEDLKELLEDIFTGFQNQKQSNFPDYISAKEAMKLFGIRSSTTLKKYVDSNDIKIKQTSKRKILYSRKSIMNFLEKDN